MSFLHRRSNVVVRIYFCPPPLISLQRLVLWLFSLTNGISLAFFGLYQYRLLSLFASFFRLMRLSIIRASAFLRTSSLCCAVFFLQSSEASPSLLFFFFLSFVLRASSSAFPTSLFLFLRFFFSVFCSGNYTFVCPLFLCLIASPSSLCVCSSFPGFFSRYRLFLLQFFYTSSLSLIYASIHKANLLKDFNFWGSWLLS